MVGLLFLLGLLVLGAPQISEGADCTITAADTDLIATCGTTLADGDAGRVIGIWKITEAKGQCDHTGLTVGTEAGNAFDFANEAVDLKLFYEGTETCSPSTQIGSTIANPAFSGGTESFSYTSPGVNGNNYFIVTVDDDTGDVITDAQPIKLELTSGALTTADTDQSAYPLNGWITSFVSSALTTTTVSASGSQTATLAIPSTDQYLGGMFVIAEIVSSRNVTGITITENGSVDAAVDLDNIRLYYELDVSAPHDCAGETYAGSETQFGSTDTNGFSAADGTSTFTGSVAVSTAAAMCVYVVLDVGSGATHGDTLEIKIDNPASDVTVGSGLVRPTTAVEISATTTLELPLTTHYRSVGTGGTIYTTGQAAVAPGSTTVTFSAGAMLPDMYAVGAVGPGDKLTIGAEVFHILSRDSATQVTVQSPAVGDHSTPATYAIERAYATLSGWEDDRDNAADRDLVSENAIEVAVCYKDGVLQEADVVQIAGWTTGPNNYIRIWVPEGQRHTGVAGTGFVLKPVTSTPQNWFEIFWLDENYIRFEGIEIDGSGITGNAIYVAGIADGNASGGGDIRVDKCLIHDITTPTQADCNGLAKGIEMGDEHSSRITNNIVYNIESNTSCNTLAAVGIDAGDTGTHYLYNNTVYNVGNGNAGFTGSVAGIARVNSSTTTATNNYAGGTYGPAGATVEDFSGTMTQSYNMSSDGTASGTGSQVNVTAYDDSPACPGAASACIIFESLDSGMEDFHLRDDVTNNDAQDKGDDLSSTLTDDVDGQIRPTGANTWDVGADEYTTSITAAVTGTITPATTEGAIVSGGATIVITLTNDTWDANIGLDNSQTTDLINGLDSNGFGAGGWDAVVKAGLDYTDVARTSATVVTMTLPAFAGYAITSDETITVYVPASALVSSTSAVVAAPTFDVVNQSTTYYRSVGTGGTVYTTGKAAVGLGSTTVTFSDGATLPDMSTVGAVGPGDKLTIGAEVRYILSRDSVTQVTLQSPATSDHSTPATYTIERAYGTLSGWEDDRDNAGNRNLVSEDAIEVAVCYKDGALNDTVQIQGWTTGPSNYIRIWVLPGQRHTGTAGSGFVLKPVLDSQVWNLPIRIQEEYVRLEGIELDGSSITNGDWVNAITIESVGDVSDVRIDKLLLHDIANVNGAGGDVHGIIFNAGSGQITNTVVYDVTNNDDADTSNLYGILLTSSAASVTSVYSSTVYNVTSTHSNNDAWHYGLVANAGTTTVANTYVGGTTTAGADTPFDFSGITTPSYNMSSDGTASGTGSQTNVTAYDDSPACPGAGSACIMFESIDSGTEDFHLRDDSALNDAQGQGDDLSSIFRDDIDGELRPSGAGTWAIGADEVDAVATAVALSRFEALGGDGLVEVRWWTSSERDNAGFHLYRASSGFGPWERITKYLIRGLGSAPEGHDYSYLDPGLVNGTTYFYRLEDVEYSGRVSAHGPVWATPEGPSAGPGEGPGPEPNPGPAPGPEPSPAPPTPGPGLEGWTAHGDPTDVSLREVSRSRTSVTFELVTGGFYSRTYEDGTTRLAVPGFVDLAEAGLPVLPTKRLWTPALTGRGARVVSAQAFDTLAFDGLHLPTSGVPTLVDRADGTRRASFRPVQALDIGHGFWPGASARVLQTAFQREEKKAYLELAPLTLDAASGRLTLARRLLVQLLFDGIVPGETGSGSRGRHRPPDLTQTPDGQVLARFGTQARGVYAVTFEDALGASFDMLPASRLRLGRRGVETSFAVAPRAHVFGPGSTLYFFSHGADDAYATEAVYELTLSQGSSHTTRRALHPDRDQADVRGLAAPAVPYLRTQRSFEHDAVYSAANTAVDELWVWDYGIAYGWGPDYESEDYAFDVVSLVSGVEDARLGVHLQGATDLLHHVLVSVNDTLVADSSFHGTGEHSIEVSFASSLLREGANTLTLAIAPDSEWYSHVKLDRFEITWPRNVVASAGILEGQAPVSGTVSASGFGSGALLLDLTEDSPRWLRSAAGDTLTFSARAGHRYLAVASSDLLAPTVHSVTPNTLRDIQNQADWILIAPRDFLPAAQTLVLHRQGQGLTTRAVALEDVYAAFGHGEPAPKAIKDFVAFAFHSWTRPSPRYVFLLGEATYDPKGRLGDRPRSDRLPTTIIPGPFGWTASDLDFAAVNGTDHLPDIAIGRLNVNSTEEATAAVQKIIDFENDTAHDLFGNAVFVADNPDPRAGDFEANVHDIAAAMPTRPVQKLFRRSLGDVATHDAILDAFDDGASFMSYVGHGGSGIWAYHTVLNAGHASSLLAQTRQPLLLTMTCSTGYFLSPYSNSITEAFVLAEGKGAIAAFSPTSESYNDAAHVFHAAVVQRLESRSYNRIGDLILDAQVDYAGSGAFPDLLRLYHLFGDPALEVR